MTNDTTKPIQGIVPPGFRLPAETTVGPVRLLVSDLTRSVAYYEHVLGLRPFSLPNGSGFILTPHGEERSLVQLETRPGIRLAPRRSSLGLYHFAIRVPDRAALGSFLAHVASIGIYTGMSDHLVSEAIYLTDPDGLGIEVYADRPRSEWRYSGRQLAMATEPLDARALVLAGEGKPWTGMPAGTVMGHVHLHVADLATAEAFYHVGLGFDKVVWSYPGALFLSAGGYHHHLGTNTWSASVPPANDQARLLSWDLEVPTRADADAAARSLESASYQVDRHGDVRLAADPWGTTLRIVPNRTREPLEPENLRTLEPSSKEPAMSLTATAIRTYYIDKSHSEATFQVRHLLTKVRGRFSDFEGTIDLDELHPERSSVSVTIQAASIDTNEPARDAHLRSADFFAADEFAAVNFTSTQIVPAGDDRFDVTGDITIRGVTKRIVVPVTVLGKAKDPWGNERLAFEAEFTINRKEFGLNWNAALETGGFLVGDDVRVTLSVQALAK